MFLNAFNSFLPNKTSLLRNVSLLANKNSKLCLNSLKQPHQSRLLHHCASPKINRTLSTINRKALAIDYGRQANHFLEIDECRLQFTQKRFKKKKSKQAAHKNQQSLKEEDEDDEEEADSDEEALEELGDDLDTKVHNTTVISCRLDAVGKTCFSMSRAKFDESFYSNLIRVNGERVGKKSYDVRENDQIDLIRGFNMDDSAKLDVNRVEILKFDDKAASSGRFRIQFKKTNKLTIDNYKNDPFDGTLIST